MQILLVEDDTAIAVPLIQNLVRAGFEVNRVGTVKDALEAPLPDVLLLDLGLPDGDGIDVARAVRARSDVPILIISARGEELDQVVGLEVGADDYLVKPFGMRELVARIRAVQRRAGATNTSADPAPQGTTTEVLTVGNLTIDRPGHRVTVNGEPIHLTPKEFEVLAHLAAEPDVVHRREAILDAVWDHSWYGPSRTLNVHIAALRRKLGDPGWIETVRGIGYRLRADRSRAESNS